MGHRGGRQCRRPFPVPITFCESVGRVSSQGGGCGHRENTCTGTSLSATTCRVHLQADLARAGHTASCTDVRHGIRRSMGRVGSRYDNAIAESFFQGLERELLHGSRWTSKAQTRLELFGWLSYYNQRRRHSALGHLAPGEYEQQLITSRTLSLVA
ncbi:integrase-like protein [Streptomyces sp. SLBN-118]|nr:integrase-like protein [Streptomyces sp. SLBN-118]